MAYKETRKCPVCGKELFYSSYSSYHLAIKKNSLCRVCSKEKQNFHRKCDLSPLLEETPEAYYWIGFLLSDGHFYDGRINFCLSLTDGEHVKKFGKFVKYTGKYRESEKFGVNLSAKHTKIVNELCEKFHIKSNKTYSPPDTIMNHNEKLLKYLFIGFVDGDGKISADGVTIKIHGSWFKILEEFSTLFDEKINPKITKDGYATIRIPRRQLEKHIIGILYDVPYLERKWSRIINMNDENIYKSYKLSDLTKKIIELVKSGLKNREISSLLNITVGHVDKVKSQYNIGVKRVDKEKSELLKKQIVFYIDEGLKNCEIKNILNVSDSYISRIKKQHTERKDNEKQYST